MLSIGKPAVQGISPWSTRKNFPDEVLVDLTLRNIADLSTGGAQLSTKWSADYGMTHAEADIHGAYFFEFAERITPTAPTISLLRTQDGPAALQIASHFSVTVRDVEFGTFVHYQSGFDNESTVPAHHVPAWTTFDLEVGYRKRDSMFISLMMRNIFNREFPLLNDPTVDQSYDLLNGLSVHRQLTLDCLIQL